MFDFHKYTVEENTHTFKHHLFLEGRKDLIKQILRKSSSSNCFESPFQAPVKTELTPLLQKMHDLYNDNQNSEKHIKTLEEKIENIRDLNSQLSTQIQESRERIKNYTEMLIQTATLMGTKKEDFSGLLNLDYLSHDTSANSHELNMAVNPQVRWQSISNSSNESRDESGFNKSDDDTNIYLQSDI